MPVLRIFVTHRKLNQGVFLSAYSTVRTCMFEPLFLWISWLHSPILADAECIATRAKDGVCALIVQFPCEEIKNVQKLFPPKFRIPFYGTLPSTYRHGCVATTKHTIKKAGHKNFAKTPLSFELSDNLVWSYTIIRNIAAAATIINLITFLLLLSNNTKYLIFRHNIKCLIFPLTAKMHVKKISGLGHLGSGYIHSTTKSTFCSTNVGCHVSGADTGHRTFNSCWWNQKWQTISNCTVYPGEIRETAYIYPPQQTHVWKLILNC